MFIIWFFVAIAILLIAWLILARQRLAQDKKSFEERRRSLQSRRVTVYAELRKALPKQTAKLSDNPSAQDLQSFFTGLDKSAAQKTRLLREELVALDDKLAEKHLPR